MSADKKESLSADCTDFTDFGDEKSAASRSMKFALIAKSVGGGKNAAGRGTERQMDVGRFERWLGRIGQLDAPQRSRALRELILAEANEPPMDCAEASMVGAMAPAAAERSSAVPTTDRSQGEPLLAKLGRERIAQFGCPYCGGEDIGAWGNANDKPRCRCADCRRTFDPLTGTPLAGLHHPDRGRNRRQSGKALQGGVHLAFAQFAGEFTGAVARRRNGHALGPRATLECRDKVPFGCTVT